MMTRPLPEDSATVDAVALGRRVRHLRKQAGLTLDQLAERTGVSGSHLSLVENARREPRLSLVQRIAEVLGVPVEDLLTGRAASHSDMSALIDRALDTVEFTFATPGGDVGTLSGRACSPWAAP